MESSGAWYRTGTVNVTNGAKAIVGVGTTWKTALIAIAVGDIFTLDMKTWYEAIAVDTDTGITLDRNYEGGTVNGASYAIIRNTSGTILTRIAGQIAVQFNQKQLLLDELRIWLNSSNATENVTDSHGVTSAITTPKQMAADYAVKIAQVDSLIVNVQVMTKAEHEGLAEIQRQIDAGSGVDLKDPRMELVLKEVTGTADVIHAPANTFHVHGYKIKKAPFNIPQAPAPNGLQRTDGGTDFADIAAAIVAGGTNLSLSILSRQDLPGLEPFFEKVSKLDRLYPNGDINYDQPTWLGVTLAKNGPQSFHAVGPYDTVTHGYSLKISTASAEDLAVFYAHSINLHTDNGVLVDVYSRWRMISGLGDNWANADNSNFKNAAPYGYVAYSAPDNYVQPQGSSNTAATFTKQDPRFKAHDYAGHTGGGTNIGAWKANAGNNTEFANAHNGLCFLITFRLIQRRNQGVGHPLNTVGTKAIRDATSGVAYRQWYADVNSLVNSLSDCFMSSDSGAIASGQELGRYQFDGKFYDQILQSDILATHVMSCQKSDDVMFNGIVNDSIAGRAGYGEGVSTTMIGSSTITKSGAGIFEAGAGGRIRIVSGGTNWLGSIGGNGLSGINASSTQKLYLVGDNGSVHSIPKGTYGDIYQTGSYTYFGATELGSFNTDFPDGTVIHVVRTSTPSAHQSLEPSWADVIGPPAKIQATMATLGITELEAQWIDTVPNGDPASYMLNRKSLDNPIINTRTLDNGGSWASADLAINNTLNGFDASLVPNYVALRFYKTQAHFTESSDRLALVGEPKFVYAGCSDTLQVGCLLFSSLLGKIFTTIGSPSTPVRWVTGLISTDKYFNDLIYNNGYTAPTEHHPINLGGVGPAAKTLIIEIEVNGKRAIGWHYKEIVHNGTSWGDDNQFQPTDNQTSVNDLNGNPALRGFSVTETCYWS